MIGEDGFFYQKNSIPDARYRLLQSMTVSFTEWVSESLSHLQTENRSLPSRIARPLYYAYVGALLSVTKRYRWGTNVFDRDWDLLVVLDACRVDALREVADEYGFVGDVESMTSVGSTSFEWMNHTFDSKHRGNDLADSIHHWQHLYPARSGAKRGYGTCRDAVWSRWV
ncbi:hypothetical protein ACFPM1_07900 [Halorubrum rubrum]|uniref:Nucleotidyltransferase family protein n=1 Tax=Halorubrum rubrum TaxID=1126240 RepID=A0ABD5R194_9EURY|nr:hypothetical protein [Halorubrum rubrum]